MLVLSRKIGQEIVIHGDIRLSIVSIRGQRVKIGIAAPDEVAIRRMEVAEARSEQRAVPIPFNCAAEAG